MRNRQLEIARLGRENKYSWGIPDNEGFVTFKKKSSERCLQYIFSAFRNKRRPAASGEHRNDEEQTGVATTNTGVLPAWVPE